MAEGEATLFDLIAGEDLAGLEAALAGGADPNQGDHRGQSPLARAVSRGSLDMVACLLGKGATPDGGDGAGNTPLMQACARGHVEIARTLLAAGADPQGANKWGFSARDWSSWSDKAGDIQALLRDSQS